MTPIQLPPGALRRHAFVGGVLFQPKRVKVKLVLEHWRGLTEFEASEPVVQLGQSQ